MIDVRAFLPPVTLPVGLGVSDVQAVDTTGSGRLDLVVTNKLTGQVSILHNLGDGTFAASRALSRRDRIVGDRSRQHARGHQPGCDGRRGRRAAHAGRSDRPGDDQPRLEHARRAGRPGRRPVRQSRSPSTTPSPAQVVRMADFTGNGIDDLAVLTADGVSIYLANGQGRLPAPDHLRRCRRKPTG